MDRKEALWNILQDQYVRHQGMQCQDVYKLLFQAACGGEHILKDGDRALALLNAEWEGLGRPPDGEPLQETIDPEGEFVRINLRVYRNLGGTTEVLFDVFAESWQVHRQDKNLMKEYSSWTIEGCKSGLFPADAQELKKYFCIKERIGFPPEHHSRSYVRCNRPAYRLVRKSVWENRVQA